MCIQSCLCPSRLSSTVMDKCQPASGHQNPCSPQPRFHRTSQSSLVWHQHLSTQPVKPATRSDELSTSPSSIILRSPSGISLSQAVSRLCHQQASPVNRPPDVTPATPLNVGWTSYHQQHPEIDPHALRPDQDIRTPPSKANLANMRFVPSKRSSASRSIADMFTVPSLLFSLTPSFPGAVGLLSTRGSVLLPFEALFF